MAKKYIFASSTSVRLNNLPKDVTILEFDT
jgi:hypothetical protein